MDLTKLRDKWRDQAKRQWEDGDNGQSIQSDACADELDSVLAAVPQDTVEALREAVVAADNRFYSRPLSDTTTKRMDVLDAAIRSVLAARPVRAVLTEGQVRLDEAKWWRDSYNTVGSVEQRNIAYNSRQVRIAELERQNAEPPENATVEEAQWSPESERGPIKGLTDVEEAKVRLLALAKFIADNPYFGAPCFSRDILLVCGAKHTEAK